MLYNDTKITNSWHWKRFIFSPSKILDYKQCLEKQKQIIRLIIIYCYYQSNILHAGWEGAGGGLHAARLNTRVAKQPKAKQLHKLFSAVPLDFTNQWHQPPKEAVRWSNRQSRGPPRVLNVDKSPRGVRRKRIIWVSEWLNGEKKKKRNC